MQNQTTMSEATVTQFRAELILIVINLAFQLFQTFIMGMKLRVHCKNCAFSMRPKGTTPSPASDTLSPEKQLTPRGGAPDPPVTRTPSKLSAPPLNLESISIEK